jgi:hypothetical protein
VTQIALPTPLGTRAGRVAYAYRRAHMRERGSLRLERGDVRPKSQDFGRL